MGFLKFVLPLVFLGLAVAEPRWLNSSDGRRYLVNSEQKFNWLSAAKECSQRNLQLVEIDSEAKNEALVELLRSTFGRSVDLWLGANDEFNKAKDLERPFYWRTSGKRMDYSYWSDNSPNNDNSEEHCVHTCAKSANFKWDDHSCTEKNGYICEEQPSYEMHRRAMQIKGQKVIDVNRKLFANLKEEQQKVQGKLHRIMNQIEKKNSEIEKFLEETHSNLAHNVQQDMRQHNHEVKRFSEDIRKQTRELDEELRYAANQMENKLSTEFSKAEQVIDYVLGNMNESRE